MVMQDFSFGDWEVRSYKPVYTVQTTVFLTVKITPGSLSRICGEFGATDHPNSEIEGRSFRLELTSVNK